MLPIIPKGIWMVTIPVTGFVIGWYLDRLETERLSYFRDKSALYGRILKEGEKPSWP
ncbi:NADH dehydrogenase (ubiquinone) MNLL subunit [Rhynchophorus ferrugineus]|uniref:NADH dehydrogenase (ubiquinone) MNLL subunit n=1 Tax=Rhynchophorus ferrugineus TaxID=354439 RepID=UPI003FCE64C9